MGTNVLSSRAIIGEFYNTLQQGAAGWANLLSFPVKSDQAGEDYKWLGMSPVMREWVGGRQAKGLRDSAYSIRNKPWESTLEIDIDDLRRDKSGQILVRVAEQAESANAHWLRLLSTLVNNGGATLCYDGQYFYDTDHSEGDSGSQSNAIALDISDMTLPSDYKGSATAPGALVMNNGILKCLQSMMGFKDDQGEPMNETAKNFLVMTPVSLFNDAVAAVRNGNLGNGGAANTIQSMNEFKMDVVANPRLTATDEIYLFRTDGRVKPFIRQEEVPVEVSAVAEGSELEFKYRKHHYGLYASGNAGYGLWQHSVRGKFQA